MQVPKLIAKITSVEEIVTYSDESRFGDSWHISGVLAHSVRSTCIEVHLWSHTVLNITSFCFGRQRSVGVIHFPFPSEFLSAFCTVVFLHSSLESRMTSIFERRKRAELLHFQGCEQIEGYVGEQSVVGITARPEAQAAISMSEPSFRDDKQCLAFVTLERRETKHSIRHPVHFNISLTNCSKVVFFSNWNAASEKDPTDGLTWHQVGLKYSARASWSHHSLQLKMGDSGLGFQRQEIQKKSIRRQLFSQWIRENTADGQTIAQTPLFASRKFIGVPLKREPCKTARGGLCTCFSLFYVEVPWNERQTQLAWFWPEVRTTKIFIWLVWLLGTVRKHSLCEDLRWGSVCTRSKVRTGSLCWPSGRKGEVAVKLLV